MTTKYHYYKYKGLSVIHFQTGDKQISKLAYKFNVGSSFELPEEWGVAHMLEHNIFKGNKFHGNSIEFNRKFKKIGYAHNASTSTDKTCYHSTGLSILFTEGLKLLTDLVFHPNFPEDEFLKEKNPILNELEMYASDPIGKFFEVGREFILGARDHNIVGTKKSIEKMKHSTLINFYEEFYHLDNVTLIIEDNRSKKQLEKIFDSMDLIGSIKMKKIASSQERLGKIGIRSFNEKNKTYIATTDSLAILYAHQSIGIRSKIDILLAPLAEQILSDILFEEIRDKKGLATYTIQASFSREEYTSISNVYALVSADNLVNVKHEMENILYNSINLKSLLTDQLFSSNKLLRKVNLTSIYGESAWYAKLNQTHNIHFASYEEILDLYESIIREEVLSFLNTLLSGKKSVLILKGKGK